MAGVNVAVLETLYRFLEALRTYGIHVESAYLFGSCARGTERKWSDIDVAIVSSDFSADRFEEGVRLMKLSSRIDSRIEPVPFRPSTFIDEDPLVWEIKKEGISLIDEKSKIGA